MDNISPNDTYKKIVYTYFVMANIDTKLASIEEILKYVQRDVASANTKLDKMDDRITVNENKTTALETKVSLFAGMQGVFSVIVGAIATYLGGKS